MSVIFDTSTFVACDLWSIYVIFSVEFPVFINALLSRAQGFADQVKINGTGKSVRGMQPTWPLSIRFLTSIVCRRVMKRRQSAP